MNRQKTFSLVVAIVGTIIGVAAVLEPVVPPEWKAGVLAVVSVLNYLLLSPAAKLFDAVLPKSVPESE